MTAGWQPTWALRRAAALVLLGCGGALVLGMPGLALCVLPLAVGSARAWSRGQAQQVSLAVQIDTVAEQHRPSTITLQAQALGATELAAFRLPPHRLRHGAAQVVLRGDAGSRQLSLDLDTDSWGTQEPAVAGVRGIGRDGLWITPPSTRHVPAVRILPATRTVPAAELPARAAGQVGAHRTRRPGEGSELLDVREFRPGDRIRRIDWRVSARRDVLHVRHTAVDADADLVLCLDTRWDVAPALAGTEVVEGSSLRRAVEIAASLATTYLHLGDRVSLVDLSLPVRNVRPGSGRRQLMRIRWQLAGMTPDRHLRRHSFRPDAVPNGAVLVVLTPFLDRHIDEVLLAMVRSHRDVIALDVLPTPRLDRDDRYVRAALQLFLAERAARQETLRGAGVVVAPWDPALLGEMLRRRARRR